MDSGQNLLAEIPLDVKCNITIVMEIDMPNLDSSIFKINLPTGKPAVGSLLVAEPFLREEYFNHGVISLVEYERGKSAMGLVLNKATGYTLGEAIEGIQDEVDIPIYCGGPLSCDRLFYLHSLGNEFRGARKIADDLYIGGDFKQVKNYVNMGLETEGKMRFLSVTVAGIPCNLRMKSRSMYGLSHPSRPIARFSARMETHSGTG